MGRLTPPTGIALTVVTTLGLLTACSDIEQIFGQGAQVLTINPDGGAAYEGRCIPRGSEPVDISGSEEKTFEFDDGVSCRIVQKGEGSLELTLTGPRGTTSVTTGRDGEAAAISRG